MMRPRLSIVLILASIWAGGLLLPAPALADVCVPGSSTLCLDHGRFRAELTWTDFNDRHGSAQVAPAGSDDSGVLWFFSPDNWEMLLKVLDGCAVNERFWVFSSATTTVAYTLTVTDTLTGDAKVYRNRRGQAAVPVADTDAFATCAPKASGSGVGAADTLSAAPIARPALSLPYRDAAGEVADDAIANLRGGRFRVTVSWTDFQGNTGQGHLAPNPADDSALFWFFDSSNFELLLKVLDGCGVNGRFWFFSAGATTVQYSLHVTDTFTGVVRQYDHAAGDAPLVITDTDAVSTCGTTSPPVVALTSNRSLILNRAGDTARVQVAVTDGQGKPVPGAFVQWTSTHPEAVSVTPDGPLSARVEAVGQPPAVSTVIARYQFSQDAAVVAVARLAESAVLIDGGSILARAGDLVTLAHSPVVDALRFGNIIVSTGGSGLLGRITGLSETAQGVQAQLTPASLADAFEELVFPPLVAAPGGAAALARVQSPASQSILTDLKCKSDAGASFGLKAALLEIKPDATFKPVISHKFGIFGLEQLEISARGHVSVAITLGDLELGGEAKGKFQCDLPIFSQPIPLLCGWCLCLGGSVDASVGVEGEAHFEGSTLHVSGPTGVLEGDFFAGLFYSKDGGWSTSGNLDWSKHVEPARIDLKPAAFSSNLKISGDLDLGIAVTVCGANFGSFTLASLQAGATTDFSFAGPFDSRAPDYTGPKWHIGIFAEADPKFEVTDGALRSLLDFFHAPTSFGDLKPFFNSTLPLLQSPELAVAASPGVLDLSSRQAVTLSGSIAERLVLGDSGSIDYLDQQDGAASLLTIATGKLNGGRGQAEWLLKASDEGQHIVSARATTDWISKIFPYASQNSVPVEVRGGKPAPGAVPVIVAVSPNPVPGSGDRQTLNVSGANFQTGATANLVDVTHGKTYPDKPTVVSSASRLSLRSRVIIT